MYYCKMLAPSPPEIVFPAKHLDNNSTQTQASYMADGQTCGCRGGTVAALRFGQIK